MGHQFNAFSAAGSLDLARTPEPLPGASPTDVIVFRRLLDLSDVARVQEWLGYRAAGRRWLTQVRLFVGFHAGWARKGLKLARARVRENSCPLDRQLRDAAEFTALWLWIAAMATAKFAGAPVEHRLQKSFRQMTAALSVDPVTAVRPWRAA